MDNKKGWALKNWCFRTVVLEKFLRVSWIARRSNQSILKEINPENPLDAEAEALILWPHDVKSRLIRKVPDAGKDWGQKKKGMTEAEMVGWHHHLDGNEFKQAPGDGEGQGNLACCSPWCLKESDPTEQLNNSKRSQRSGGEINMEVFFIMLLLFWS